MNDKLDTPTEDSQETPETEASASEATEASEAEATPETAPEADQAAADVKRDANLGGRPELCQGYCHIWSAPVVFQNLAASKRWGSQARAPGLPPDTSG